MKICDMNGVRGGEPEFPVELHRDGNGRLTVRAINEGGFNCTDIDLYDLLGWLSENEWCAAIAPAPKDAAG